MGLRDCAVYTQEASASDRVCIDAWTKKAINELNKPLKELATTRIPESLKVKGI